MSFLLTPPPEKKQKTKVKDVGAGLGEGGLVSLSGITRMLLQELTPRLDLHWTDLEYLKKLKTIMTLLWVQIYQDFISI